MKKHFLLTLLVILPLGASILSGCGGSETRPDVAENASSVPGQKPEGQR